MTILIADLESDGLLDELSRIHCIVTQDYVTGQIKRYNSQGKMDSGTHVGHGIQALSEADLVVFHNGIGFDVPAIKKLYPDWQEPKVFDTLVGARLVWSDIIDKDFKRRSFPPKLRGRHSLKAWGYRLKLHKGDFGEETDWKEWSQEMEDYCVQDVRVTSRLYEEILKQNYSQEALDLEHEFAWLIARQERHGFAFNVDKASELYYTLSKRRNILEETLRKVFGPTIETMKTPVYWIAKYGDKEYHAATKTELQRYMRQEGYMPKDYTVEKGPMKTKEIPFNPGSRQEIERRLREKYGWKPKEFTPSGQAKVDEAVLAALSYPECKMLAEYFLVQKRIGQVSEGESAWLKLEKKGRIHGSVNTIGAVTRRCTHSGPNVAQVPAPRAAYGSECRACFQASDGYKLVGWDASGLELRCLAHYLGKYDGGKYAKELLEGDIHTANQKAAGLETRDQAKTFIYALCYGAGDAKIGQIIGKGAKAGKALKTRFFRSIPALKRLTDDVKNVAKKRGWLKALDGGRLSVRSQHSALNTLLQSAGALVMKKAHCLHWQKLQELGYVWGKDVAKVADVHDEAEWECLPGIAEVVGETAIQSIKEAGEHFNFRCPLDGEYKIGDTWADVH